MWNIHTVAVAIHIIIIIGCPIFLFLQQSPPLLLLFVTRESAEMPLLLPREQAAK